MKKASMALVALSLSGFGVIEASGSSLGAPGRVRGVGLPGPRPAWGPPPGGRPHPGRRRIPEHMRGRPLRVRPPMSSQPDEVMAARLVAEASQGMSCERAGEMLRKLSNRLLASAEESYRPAPPPYAQPPRGGGRRPGAPMPGGPRFGETEKQRWRGHFKSPQFWKEVWDRLAEAYQSCEADCFDDGVAVGVLSAVGYCSASIEVGGLPAPGLLLQGRLPLCENSIFIGCQQGYAQGVGMTEGCAPYTEGLYRRVFLESQSQDCHLDDPASL